MKLPLLALTISLLLVPQLHAASEGTSMAGIPTSKVNYSEKSNRVALDTIPVLLKGVGLSFEHQLGERFTFGPSFSTLNLNSELFTKFDNRMYIGGLRGRYYTNHPNRSSVYFLGGAQYVQVSTTTESEGFIFTAASPKSEPKKSSGVGAVFGVGWQRARKDQSFFFNVGLNGMYGAAIKNSGTYSAGKSEVTKNELGYGANLELNLGFMI
jgi:hypothetical protein